MDVLFGLSILVSFFIGSCIGVCVDSITPFIAGTSAAVGMFFGWIIGIFALGAYRAIKQPYRIRYHFPRSFSQMADAELENGPPPTVDDRLSIRQSVGVALLWLGFRVGG